MTADLNEKFDKVKVASKTPDPSQEAIPLAAEGVASIARDHVAGVEERLLLDRAKLFEAAVADPRRLWNGELVELPDDADGEISDPAFSHLAEDGELSPIIVPLQDTDDPLLGEAAAPHVLVLSFGQNERQAGLGGGGNVTAAAPFGGG